LLHSAIKPSKKHIIFSLLLILSLTGYGQRRIKLEPGSSNLTGFKKDGVSYISVKDNVEFTHRGTKFYCDSAVLAKKTNYLEAYGNVKIVDGDSVTIIAEKLLYDGNTRVANLRRNVILTQLGRMQLFTDYLDYDRNTAIATYFNNGKIVDTTNVLTSKKGYYNTNTNMASFKTNVVGENDDYTMRSDTLRYNTKSGVVYFVASTELTDVDGNVFVHEGGQYNSKEQRSSYTMGEIQTEDYYLRGKDLRLDDIRKIYYVSGDVYMLAKEDDIIITGQQSIYDRKNAITTVYDDAMMKMVTEGDTLYLRADTLVSIDSSIPEEKRLLAYNNVRIFKSNLQATADSIAYAVSDSVMYFYTDPVMWTSGNQLTADSINMVIHNSSIDTLNLKGEAFVITQDSSRNYNQIKGREMVAKFVASDLKQVNVYGNGESIFYMYDEITGLLVGMNSILCSNIKLIFEDRMLKDASFLVNPEGKFIPPHELTEEDKTLRGFKWLSDRRPELDEFVGQKPIGELPITAPDNQEIDLELKKKGMQN
jgi:lipopolysaccharide export system protein LptA